MGNSREMWKCLKKAVHPNPAGNNISRIVVNDILYLDDLNIANAINDYFIESIKTINDNIEETCYEVKYTPIADKAFKFKTVHVNDIINIVCKFKYKIGGKNLLSSGVIKDSISYTGYFYSQLINDSLTKGVFPSSWKQSLIKPIKKVIKTIKVEELRPINTLPSDEKILETVVKQQLVDYIENNNILISEQSGFRRHHSCETALNIVFADWKEKLSENKFIVAVFLDLKRAFKTIDINIMLKKFRQVGVHGVELQWFQSFLTGRSQRTLFGSSLSSERIVDIGLPQESVLAPILFNLYTNDISHVITKCDIELFADDTLITISGTDIVDILYVLQKEFDKIFNWFCCNKLKINVNKTKYMIITRKKIVKENLGILTINNEVLELVKEIKY